MSLKLKHYVYSSVDGYRTLYASNGIPENVVTELEEIAKRVYRTAQTRDFYIWLTPNNRGACLIKGFQSGTDHVGRRRSCVHAVLISVEDVAGRSFFSPLILPESIFMAPNASLRAVKNFLLPEFELTKAQAPGAPVGISKETLSAILTVMLEPNVRVLIRDNTGAALRAIRSLAWTLPPALRETLSVAAFEAIPDYPLFGGPRITILPPEVPLEDDLPKFDIEFAVPVEDIEDVDIDFNVYAEFVASNVMSDDGLLRVRKTIEFLERQSDNTQPTEQQYLHLFDAVAKVENQTARGLVDIKEHPAAALDAVLDFVNAGLHMVALEIMDAIITSAAGKYDIEFESYRSVIEKLRAGGKTASPNAYEYVVKLLKDMVDQVGWKKT